MLRFDDAVNLIILQETKWKLKNKACQTIMYLYYFCYLLPQCKLGRKIGPVVLEKKIFKNILCNFTMPLLHPPEKRFGTPFEQTSICAKFGWNWSSGSWEKIFKYHQCIFIISLLSPLENGHGPSLIEQTWIPFIQWSFEPSLVDIDPVVQEEEILIKWGNFFTDCMRIQRTIFEIISNWNKIKPTNR